jgi:hypothetical protein
MSVVGQRTKNGVRYATFGCAAHNSRGDAICDNALTISEKRVTAALIGSLRDLFTAPDVVRRMTESIAAKVSRLSKSTASKPSQASIAEVEHRIRHLTDALARLPASAALLDKLEDEERHLAKLKNAKRAPVAGSVVRPPNETQVQGFLADLVGTPEADPVAGRAALADILTPVTCTPSPSPRGYRCKAEVKTPSTFGLGREAEVLGMSGSGGALGSLIYRISKVKSRTRTLAPGARG